MHRFGLIGYPLTHSFSQRYFTDKFAHEGLTGQCCYDVFPLEHIAEFPRLLTDNPDLVGLNVTIPHKTAVIPYLDALSPSAAEIGAVNTIRITGGKTMGHNTDVIGFQDTLLRFLAANGGPSQGALVLGTGGAARAVAWVLENQKIPYTFISTKPNAAALCYEDVTPAILAETDLIINTTPLGMLPNADTFPHIPYLHLAPKHRLYDLVYNPAQTLFMAQGIAQGAAAMNGYEMLIGQAEAAWGIWNA